MSAVERLALARLCRGLLTAALRARLRKAGTADTGMLALAMPADLVAVRKIGPARVAAIRADILTELAQLSSGARAAHSQEATASCREGRLHAIPVEKLPLDAPALGRLLASDQPSIRVIPAMQDVAAAPEAQAWRKPEALREQDRE